MISEARVLELQKIFKEDYGKELSSQEASDMAYALVDFFATLIEIDQRDTVSKTVG